MFRGAISSSSREGGAHSKISQHPYKVAYLSSREDISEDHMSFHYYHRSKRHTIEASRRLLVPSTGDGKLNVNTIEAAYGRA